MSCLQDLSSAKTAANSLQSSSGQHDQALQQKQNEVGDHSRHVSRAAVILWLTLTSCLQLMAVRETNRQLDNKVEQLQSFLQEQAASNKQARVCLCCLPHPDAKKVQYEACMLCRQLLWSSPVSGVSWT